MLYGDYVSLKSVIDLSPVEENAQQISSATDSQSLTDLYKV